MKRLTIGTKLFRSLFTLLFLLLLIAIAGIICINILKSTSNKIVLEYRELDAVQDLRFNFNQIILPAYDFLLYENNEDLEKFRDQINTTKESLVKCNEIISNNHNKKLLLDIESKINKVFHIIYNSQISSFDVDSNRKVVVHLESILNEANNEIFFLLNETQNEINKYILVNKTASFHSSLTIVILAIIIIILSTIFGIRFVKTITNPIKQLLNSTKKVTSGDFSVKTTIDTKDEFRELAFSFNNMVDNLNNTTISKDYFDKIIGSMFESLIVTDMNKKITLVNNATSNLLKYSNDELIGRNIRCLIKDENTKIQNINFDELVKKSNISNIELKYKAKKQGRNSSTFLMLCNEIGKA
jgi:PAS domain S-box-containing protein